MAMKVCAVGQLRGKEFENNCSQMYCGSEAGLNLRLIDLMYHSSPSLREIKRKKRTKKEGVGRVMMTRQT